MSTPLAKIRRWHRWWFLPIELAGLALLLVVWWSSAHSAIGRLRASGAPVSYEDLVAEPIPDEENAAAGLRDLAPALKRSATQVADLLDMLDADSGANDEQARRLIADQTETLAALHQAVERPRHASLLGADEIDDIVTPSILPTARAAARLLTLEGRVAIAEGQSDRATDAAVALARLGKHYEREPLIVNRLMACALQTYATDLAERIAHSGPLPPEDAERLDAALEELEDRSGLAWTLRTERALTLEKLAEMPINVRLWEQSSLLRLYEQAIEAAEKRFAQPGSGGAYPALTATQSLSSLLAQTFQASWDAENRVAEEAQRVRQKPNGNGQ